MPESDCFSADGGAQLSQQIFDISMAEVEARIKPDGVTDGIGWKSAALVFIQRF
ncbi:MAG: hypothetical protein ACNYPE_06595 [Candidatus Azotimanducaceae bacterium WSBS_2022_MAG_OTU7]